MKIDKEYYCGGGGGGGGGGGDGGEKQGNDVGSESEMLRLRLGEEG